MFLIMAESNVILAHKAHEVVVNVEKVLGEENLLTLAIFTRNVVTGKMQPVIVIEGELEELDSFHRRISRAIERTTR